MGLFDKEDGKSRLKFFATLNVPFVLAALFAVLIIMLKAEGGPF